jgi:hypothetical protein
MTSLGATAEVATYSLPRTKRNAVLGAIQGSGLNPPEFQWEEQPSSQRQVRSGGEPFTVEVLVHRPTGYWFMFDVDANHEDSAWAVYKPGPNGGRRSNHAGTWDYVFGYVTEWLARVRVEHEAPDLWGEFQRLPGAAAGELPGVENTLFDPEEQAAIVAQLQEIKRYVRQTYELTAEQHQLIDARLDYFAEAAARLPRLDWRNAFLGAFIGLVFQTILPAEPVQHLLFMALRGLGSVFGQDVPGLPAA